MKKIVLTGASGLVGFHLIKNLGQQYQIFPVLRRPQDVQFRINYDFNKPWDESVFPHKIDAVIHLAQSEHFRNFPEGAQEIFEVNTLSTMHLLNYARKAGAKSFILASSGGVYGMRNEEFLEDQQIESRGNLGFYFGTKLCSEILTENYSSVMNVIIMRFFFAYGPGQKQNMLIPRLVQQVKDGLPIILQGNDGIKLNPIYVSDVTAAICKALELNGSYKINVAGHEVLSMRRIGEIIGGILGRECNFEIQPEGNARNLIGDTEKMSKLLLKSKITFEEGVRRYINSALLQ
jgi:UDP-glucose 4-epimerase